MTAPFDHGMPPTGDDEVVMQRRDVRSLYRGVLVVLALVLMVVTPIGVVQVQQHGTNDRLAAQTARVDRLVDENRRETRLAVAQACVNSHRGYERFTQFMGQVRRAVVLADPAEFDALVAAYPSPTCDLEGAERQVERLDRSAP